MDSAEGNVDVVATGDKRVHNDIWREEVPYSMDGICKFYRMYRVVRGVISTGTRFSSRFLCNKYEIEEKHICSGILCFCFIFVGEVNLDLFGI